MHGHLVGDEVLRTIGKLLLDQGILRKSDLPGRFGGEEFIIVLPETQVKRALGPAQRLIQALKEIRFKGKNQINFTVTLSVGISELRKGEGSSDIVIHRADKALYYAKEHGKDRAIIYSEVYED
jgi:diguanylate cyclase (GGDEF)-like protein